VNSYSKPYPWGITGFTDSRTETEKQRQERQNQERNARAQAQQDWLADILVRSGEVREVIAGGSYGGQGLTVVKKDGTTFSFTLYGEEKQAYKVTR
jgi:hypothetical protein